MKNIHGGFKEFMKQRAEASESYVRGDAEPLDGIAAKISPASFFSPGGGLVTGASKGRRQYKRDAQMFEPNRKKGRKGSFKILQMEADGNIAYWVGFQTGSVRMRGKRRPFPRICGLLRFFVERAKSGTLSIVMLIRWRSSRRSHNSGALARFEA